MNSKMRRTIEQTAHLEGALRVEWLQTQQHLTVRFHMPDGLVVSMPISRSSRTDDYKYRGWTRQYIRNASRWHVRPR